MLTPDNSHPFRPSGIPVDDANPALQNAFDPGDDILLFHGPAEMNPLPCSFPAAGPPGTTRLGRGRDHPGGGSAHKLYVFVMGLGYIRRLFARFTISTRLTALLRCLQDAFSAQGIPREILVDKRRNPLLS